MGCAARPPGTSAAKTSVSTLRTGATPLAKEPPVRNAHPTATLRCCWWFPRRSGSVSGGSHALLPRASARPTANRSKAVWPVERSLPRSTGRWPESHAGHWTHAPATRCAGSAIGLPAKASHLDRCGQTAGSTIHAPSPRCSCSPKTGSFPAGLRCARNCWWRQGSKRVRRSWCPCGPGSASPLRWVGKGITDLVRYLILNSNN